ncbi:MAG: ABC transporter ATP-binding protein [Halobacteriota archaeon]
MNGKTSVSFQNLTKVYGEGENSLLALDDINLEIEDGEFVSIVGPSGCGKSTLLHLTAALLDPTEGKVEIEGTDVTSEAHEKHKVGLVFQTPVLLDWRTVRKNILLPVEIMKQNGALDREMSYYKERTDELLELTGLDGFGDSYPQELSGGMQQRVSICRSLVYDPPVLLMDEPFGALDALTRDKMNKELLRIWEETEKTIVFVTHNLDEAVFLSDRVVVLDSRPGRIMDVIDVDLDRPRTQETRQMGDYHTLVSETYKYFE